MADKEKIEELRSLNEEIEKKKADILRNMKTLREGQGIPECLKEDVVNHPSHYETGKFECIEVMEEIYGRADVKAFCRCNAFKYLYRCKNKNGNQDIDKARWYINKYLDLCEEDGENPDYPSLLHDVLKAYKKYDEEKLEEAADVK